MLRYTMNRILYLIPVLFLLTVVVFSFVHCLPGDVIDVLAGQEGVVDPAVRKALEQEYGLDKPLYAQYIIWLNRVLHGNFGTSMVTRRPIAVEFFQRIPATIYLALAGTVISLLIAIPLGTMAAVKRNSAVDYTAQVVSLMGISIPEFWFALLCVLFFSLYLGWLPSSEYYSPLENLGLSIRHMILPAAALGIRQAAITTRLTRSTMLDEVQKEYVDTARSLGLPERKVIYQYTLRNAMIPTLTISGLQLAQLLGGTVVIETIFAWPGVGRTLFEAIISRDFPVIQAGVLILGIAVVLINLLVDLMYRVLNPRVRLA
ncbi:MAG: ABC transporter permease [Candidatus Tectomicrobia bacterium]|uniref:ABC transporter permease n=1 Tax=Tectimicrobiota bacterium TaxID=2528274 RepID=A0A938B5A1_UNCTE|nr:ABC transporter permease [Candidatus Tectomicrobia bacterium]